MGSCCLFLLDTWYRFNAFSSIFTRILAPDCESCMPRNAIYPSRTPNDIRHSSFPAPITHKVTLQTHPPLAVVQSREGKGKAVGASHLRKPWAPYEQSLVLLNERVFHALVDHVWEERFFKTPTSFINIQPRCSDDRRHIAPNPSAWCFFSRQKVTSCNCLPAIEQAYGQHVIRQRMAARVLQNSHFSRACVYPAPKATL